jgi:protease-4
MKYPRILAAIRAAKWAVTPVTLQAIRDTLSARLTGHLAPTAGEMDDYAPTAETDSEEPFEFVSPGIAAVELHGIIGKNLSSMEMMCGGCDLETVEENLTEALADSSTTAVILDIDSPGGSVSGVMEFAQKIGDLSTAAGKPVLSYASGQCCSAAYWIACGCPAGIIASPSSDVGSIGVYIALMDESEHWAQEGYKLVLIKAGEHKAAGIPGSQITPEQIALFQADVDYIYDQFTQAVRAARPGIADATMQGQTFYGPRAQAALLVDAIAPDLETAATLLS